MGENETAEPTAACTNKNETAEPTAACTKETAFHG
jgi:hypothetical protein